MEENPNIDSSKEEQEEIQEELEEKSAPKELLGDYLTNFRKSSGIELRTIATATRINIKILEDIEANNLSELPNPTYLRGFVKSFAKEIGADVDYTLNLLDLSLEIEAVPSPPREGQKPFKPHTILDKDFQKLQNLTGRAASISPKTLMMWLAGISICGIIFLGAYRLYESTKEQTEEILAQDQEDIQVNAQDEALAEEIVNASPVEESTAESEVEEEPIKEELTSNETLEPVIEENKTEEPAKEVKKEEVTEAEEKKPAPPKIVVFTPLAQPLYELSSNHPLLNDESVFPKSIKEAYIEGKENIFINAVNEDCWINYKNTDAPVKSFVLKKGKVLFIRGEEIRLFIGNLSGIEIFYNNQYVKTSSGSNVKSLVFPVSSISKFSTPLFIYDNNLGLYYTEEEYRKKFNLSAD